jgi:hypothetical protein
MVRIFLEGRSHEKPREVPFSEVGVVVFLLFLRIWVFFSSMLSSFTHWIFAENPAPPRRDTTLFEKTGDMRWKPKYSTAFFPKPQRFLKKGGEKREARRHLRGFSRRGLLLGPKMFLIGFGEGVGSVSPSYEEKVVMLLGIEGALPGFPGGNADGPRG